MARRRHEIYRRLLEDLRDAETHLMRAHGQMSYGSVFQVLGGKDTYKRLEMCLTVCRDLARTVQQAIERSDAVPPRGDDQT